MRFLEELTQLVDENVGKIIYYDKENKCFLVYSSIQLFRHEQSKDQNIKDIIKDVDGERFVEFFNYDKEFYQYVGEMLIKKHSSLYEGLDIGKPFAITKFKKATFELGLYDEWIDFLKNEIAFDVYEWANDEGLCEDECDIETYNSIRATLDKILENNFGNIFNSKVLFSLAGSYGHLSFNILSSDDVNGISFYIGQNDLETYKCMSNSNSLIAEPKTMSSLMDICTFYFENKPKKYSFNPYGDDGKFTSLLLAPGKISNNFLPESLAFFFKTALIDAYNELKVCMNNKNINKIDGKHYCLVKHYRNIPQTIEHIPDFKMIPDDIFYDLNKDNLYIIDSKKIINGTWSIGLRALDSFEDTIEIDERSLYYQYVLIIMDETNHKIINIRLISGIGRPVENALKELSNLFNNQMIAKNIVVNNLVDYTIFGTCLETLIEKKKINFDIVPVLELENMFDDFKSTLKMRPKKTTFDA